MNRKNVETRLKEIPKSAKGALDALGAGETREFLKQVSAIEAHLQAIRAEIGEANENGLKPNSWAPGMNRDIEKRFATKAEANALLAQRWKQSGNRGPHPYSVRATDDPVNYRWLKGKLEAV